MQNVVPILIPYCISLVLIFCKDFLVLTIHIILPIYETFIAFFRCHFEILHNQFKVTLCFNDQCKTSFCGYNMLPFNYLNVAVLKCIEMTEEHTFTQLTFADLVHQYSYYFDT